MFKYTPKKHILREMVVAKTGQWWNKEYQKRNEILRQYKVEADYTLNWILRVHYKNVCFYSKTSQRFIPVQGYLFPVGMFNEVKIEDA